MCELELSKDWPRDKFFKRRKSKFWKRQFFSIVTFKKMFDIPVLVSLFISLIELKSIY